MLKTGADRALEMDVVQAVGIISQMSRRVTIFPTLTEITPASLIFDSRRSHH